MIEECSSCCFSCCQEIYIFYFLHTNPDDNYKEYTQKQEYTQEYTQEYVQEYIQENPMNR